MCVAEAFYNAEYRKNDEQIAEMKEHEEFAKQAKIEYDELKAEIERLTVALKLAQSYQVEVRMQAIKEFSEKVKNKFGSAGFELTYYDGQNEAFYDICEEADAIAKEMTEGEE